MRIMRLRRIESAAQALVNYVAEKHEIDDPKDFNCPYMRVLAYALVNDDLSESCENKEARNEDS